MNDIEDTSLKTAAGGRGIEHRLVPLRLTEQDAVLLREISPIIDRRIEGIVDAFYNYLLDYEDTKGILQTESSVQRFKSTLRNYLEAALNCTLDRNYFEKRVNIGQN
ncbi:MAG: protoglobin domain-containing protein [Planctomycetota bacterium]|jgi:heme-based aerotactic transducer